MALTTAGTIAAGRKAGVTAILLTAALGTLSGCVSNSQTSIATSELGDPVAVTVAATGTDESGQQVALKVPLPGERPAVAIAAAEAKVDSEPTASVVALAPTTRSSGTISGSAAIDRMIEQAAAENGVPRELAFAVVHVESRYNPKAKGAGVYGLSQIMPATARSLGFSGPVEALYDPATNLRYGMKYLKGAWEKGGRDICQASMKYKGGHRATRMTKSAAAYCSNVKRHIASITGRPAAEAVQVASIAERSAGSATSSVLPTAAATAMAPTASLPGVSATSAIAARVEAPKAEAATASATSRVRASASEEPRSGSASAVMTASLVVRAPSGDPAPDPSRFGD